MNYIAYGSNINLDQMAYRCPNSKVIGKGWLTGWKLVFNIHADIIKTGKKEDKIPVLIWDIDKHDWQNLDRYEGFPSYYVKRRVKTKFENGEEKFCIAYVMANDKKGFALPWDNYFNVIAKGYKDNHIPFKYLYDAIAYTEDKENGCII